MVILLSGAVKITLFTGKIVKVTNIGDYFHSTGFGRTTNWYEIN